MKVLKWEDPEGNDRYYLWSYRQGYGFDYDLATFVYSNSMPNKGSIEIDASETPSFFKKCIFQCVFGDFSSLYFMRIKEMIFEE